MFQALFNSLSGLFSFSRSLNTVSNNISNMNTPGFRGSDSFFSNISGGRGTRIAGEGLRTSPGDIRQTGNPTDLAVDGNGYFVLRDDDGNYYYTRAGQFRFDDQGLLIDSVNGHQVMAIDESGNLISVDFDDYRSLPAEATTSIKFSGNIVPKGAGSTNPDTVVNSITVYDASGVAHVLSATFTQDSTPGRFLVTFRDSSGADVGSGEVRFGTNATPLPGYTDMELELDVGGAIQTVAVNFGTANGVGGMTARQGQATNLSYKAEDGHGILGLTSFAFDDKGVLQLTYSQTEKREGARIALVAFPNESALTLSGGRLVAGSTVTSPDYGRPGEGQFGRIAGGSLELSNVDLTQEFADMIIIQRGYQASSRVMTVSNEMLEQLYNSTRGG